MRKLGLITSTTLVLFAGLPAEAAELPTFEKLGFPITPTQVSVLGSAEVRESSPVATLTLSGMPASPHQVAVLMPRLRITEQASSAKLTATGFSAR